VVLDSNTFYEDYGGFTLEAELAFLAGALEGCERRACFLVLHHPPTTAGEHERDFSRPERVARMARVEAAAAGKVRAWLAGHDHDLQHLRTAAGVDVLISGNGATARPQERFQRVANGGQLLFASTTPGIGLLAVRQGGWDYRFEDTQGAPLHCCSATGPGPCEPVSCAGAPAGR
jgi:tartrate-resistant acid phosphatase type 5